MPSIPLLIHQCLPLSVSSNPQASLPLSLSVPAAHGTTSPPPPPRSSSLLLSRLTPLTHAARPNARKAYPCARARRTPRTRTRALPDSRPPIRARRIRACRIRARRVRARRIRARRICARRNRALVRETLGPAVPFWLSMKPGSSRTGLRGEVQGKKSMKVGRFRRAGPERKTLARRRRLKSRARERRGLHESCVQPHRAHIAIACF
mmetsp:Transcript_17342/g.37277  ORF Transcript_17342/g.37277 Transcript_17342/m.37277 type:complete len:207 (+) Transcript_17342:212-832(+)